MGPLKHFWVFPVSQLLPFMHSLLDICLQNPELSYCVTAVWFFLDGYQHWCEVHIIALCGVHLQYFYHCTERSVTATDALFCFACSPHDLIVHTHFVFAWHSL
jgi:hypothetical protein